MMIRIGVVKTNLKGFHLETKAPLATCITFWQKKNFYNTLYMPDTKTQGSALIYLVEEISRQSKNQAVA